MTYSRGKMKKNRGGLKEASGVKKRGGKEER